MQGWADGDVRCILLTLSGTILLTLSSTILLTLSGTILLTLSGTILTLSGTIIVTLAGTILLTLSGTILTLAGTIIVTLAGTILLTFSGTILTLSGTILTLSGTILLTLSGTILTLSGTILTLSGTILTLPGTILLTLPGTIIVTLAGTICFTLPDVSHCGRSSMHCSKLQVGSMFVPVCMEHRLQQTNRSCDPLFLKFAPSSSSPHSTVARIVPRHILYFHVFSYLLNSESCGPSAAVRAAERGARRLRAPRARKVSSARLRAVTAGFFGGEKTERG